eukprot:s1734_g6.t1
MTIRFDAQFIIYHGFSHEIWGVSCKISPKPIVPVPAESPESLLRRSTLAMVTSSERIKNLDCNSSVWVTKDQRESGLKYLVEKHARQGAAITARTLSGLMANGEEEQQRLEAQKTQKRQREGEVNDLMAEMARLEEEGAKPSTASVGLFARQAAKDAKGKKPLIVVKKPKVDEAPSEPKKEEHQVPAASEAASGGLLGAYSSSEEEEDAEESSEKE